MRRRGDVQLAALGPGAGLTWPEGGSGHSSSEPVPDGVRTLLRDDINEGRRELDIRISYYLYDLQEPT
jgi:hypothetical protein